MTRHSDYEVFEASSTANRRLLRQEELILEMTELISDALARQGMTRAELAQRLGKSKSFITQILSGDRNLTLRTLADVADALGYRIKASAVRVTAATAPKASTVIEAPKSVSVDLGKDYVTALRDTQLGLGTGYQVGSFQIGGYTITAGSYVTAGSYQPLPYIAAGEGHQGTGNESLTLDSGIQVQSASALICCPPEQKELVPIAKKVKAKAKVQALLAANDDLGMAA